MRTWLAEASAPFRDGFLRDLVKLFLVTVIVVSLVAAAAAWAVNAYFGETVSGLIGGVGEYDFIIHARAESKVLAARYLAAYLPKAFPGARVKQGLTVAGQANFFVALPQEMRTRAVMESIGSSFASMPGYSGRTLLIEPSIIVHGVPAGAMTFILERLERLEGVEFAFRDGQSLVVVAQRGRDVEQAEARVKELLDRYRVIEARFPMGYKVPDLDRAGEQVVAAVDRKFHSAGKVLDVSRNDRGDDYQSFLSSLTEMRRFLLSYTSDVVIELDPQASLRPGDEVAAGAGLPAPGGRLGAKNLKIMITGVEGSKAHGVAVQGDTIPKAQAGGSPRSGVIPAGRAFRVKPGERLGDPVGTATINNQRYALMATVDESLKLLDQLQGLAKQATLTASRVQSTLDAYDHTLDQITQVQATLERAEQGLSGPLEALGKVQTESIVTALNRTVRGIDDLLDRMQGVSEAQAALDLASRAAGLDQAGSEPGAPGAPAGESPAESGAGAAAAQIASVQSGMNGLSAEAREQASTLTKLIQKINPATLLLLKWRAQAQSLALQVGNFGNLTQNADGITEMIGRLSEATDSTLGVMRQMDVPAFRADLAEISRRMEGIAQIDVASVTKQMRYVRDSLPDLKDEELGRSVRLIDQYIGGEVIPGERLQILVPASLPLAEAAAEVRRAAGDKASTSIQPAGSLKPDLRGLLFQVLGKVRETVAGLVGIALVAAVLMLDHAVIISTLRTSWRSLRLPAWWGRVAAPGYGALVGATLLAAVFFLSGARLPLVGWPGVALLGAALGLLTAGLAGRLAPVNLGELEAGQALGLSYACTLREIVIPEGRPGLLLVLNRPNMIFPQLAAGGAGRKR